MSVGVKKIVFEIRFEFESRVARFPKPKYGRFLHPFPGAQWPRTLFLLLFLFYFLWLLLLSDFPVPKALSFLNRLLSKLFAHINENMLHQAMVGIF